MGSGSATDVTAGSAGPAATAGGRRPPDPAGYGTPRQNAQKPRKDTFANRDRLPIGSRLPCIAQSNQEGVAL